MAVIFFFNYTATTEIYTLSLHDALPIYRLALDDKPEADPHPGPLPIGWGEGGQRPERSEEHTSELQSHSDLVCRLLLEKKKKITRSACWCNCNTGGNQRQHRCVAARRKR